jgi:hypothetical protein
MTLSQKSKIKNKNDKSKSKNLAFPFSVVASPDLSGRSRDEEIATSPRQVGAPRNDSRVEWALNDTRGKGAMTKSVVLDELGFAGGK